MILLYHSIIIVRLGVWHLTFIYTHIIHRENIKYNLYICYLGKPSKKKKKCEQFHTPINYDILNLVII